jgi:hypothetical protein
MVIPKKTTDKLTEEISTDGIGMGLEGLASRACRNYLPCRV